MKAKLSPLQLKDIQIVKFDLEENIDFIPEKEKKNSFLTNEDILNLFGYMGKNNCMRSLTEIQPAVVKSPIPVHSVLSF